MTTVWLLPRNFLAPNVSQVLDWTMNSHKVPMSQLPYIADLRLSELPAMLGQSGRCRYHLSYCVCQLGLCPSTSAASHCYLGFSIAWSAAYNWVFLASIEPILVLIQARSLGWLRHVPFYSVCSFLYDSALAEQKELGLSVCGYGSWSQHRKSVCSTDDCKEK